MSIYVPNRAIDEALLRLAASFCSTLFWTLRNSETEQDEIHGGTVFFLDTGSVVFAVTAAHVIQGWMDATGSPMFVQAMLGANGQRPILLDAEARLIDANRDIDIATLRVTREEVAYMRCSILTGLQREWPPRAPEYQYGVVMAGFPGVETRRPAHNRFNFGCVTLAGMVTSAHDTRVSIQIFRDSYVRIFGDRDLPEHYNYGGMSGGPLLVLAERGGIQGLAPGGVIVEGPNGSDDINQAIPDFELIRAAPINFINADGTLDLDRWEQARY